MKRNILSGNAFKKLRAELYNYYKKKAFIADKHIDIDKNVNYALLSIYVSILSIILAIVFLVVSRTLPILYILSLISLAIFIVSITSLILLFLVPEYYISQRKAGIEKELPFISAYISLLAGMGLPYSRIFNELKNIDIFKFFRKEINFIEKVKMFYILSDIDAIGFISKFHPSEQLSDLYRTFVSTERSGGEKFKILLEKSRSHMRLLEDRVERLIANFITITNIEVLFFIVVPLALIVIASLMIGGENTLRYKAFIYLATFVFPYISFILINSIIENIYPKELIEIPPSQAFIITFFLSIILFAVGFASPDKIILGIKMYLVVGILVILFTLASGYYYYKWYSDSDDLIFSLNYLPGYLSDAVLKGKTPKQSIIDMLSLELPEKVSSVLKVIVTRIKLGIDVKDAIKGIKLPWLVRYWIYIVDSAERYGASHEVLDLISDSLSRLILIKKRIYERKNGFLLGTIVALLALVFGYSIVANSVLPMLADISNQLNKSSSGYGSLITNIFSPVSTENISFVTSISYIGILFNAFLMSLLAGKSIKGSLAAGLLYAPIILTITLITIEISTFIKIF